MLVFCHNVTRFVTRVLILGVFFIGIGGCTKKGASSNADPLSGTIAYIDRTSQIPARSGGHAQVTVRTIVFFLKGQYQFERHIFAVEAGKRIYLPPNQTLQTQSLGTYTNTKCPGATVAAHACQTQIERTGGFWYDLNNGQRVAMGYTAWVQAFTIFDQAILYGTTDMYLRTESLDAALPPTETP